MCLLWQNKSRPPFENPRLGSKLTILSYSFAPRAGSKIPHGVIDKSWCTRDSQNRVTGERAGRSYPTPCSHT
jgi:hypothetical protein